MLIRKAKTGSRIESLKSNRAGQSTLEYTVVIAMIACALLALQIYMKRGTEGRLRAASDDIGKQFDAAVTHVSYRSTRDGTTRSEAASGTSTVYVGVDEKGTPEQAKFWGEEHVAGFDGKFNSQGDSADDGS